MDILVTSVQNGDVLTILFLIAAFAAVATALFRSFGYSTLFAVIAVVLLAFTPATPLPWILDNKLLLLTYAGAYVGAGIAWSIFAYVLFVTKKARIYREARSHYLPYFLEHAQIKELTEEHYADFRQYLRNSNHEIRNMKLEYETSDIAVQIALWPYHVLAFVFGRMIYEVAKFISARIGGLYQSIRRWAFRKFPEFQ